MKLVKESLILEERIGEYSFKDTLGKFHYIEIYKNPISISSFGFACRAISDKYGDLYVANSSSITHNNLLNYLNKKEIATDATWDIIDKGYKNMIAWIKGDNDYLYLSESYYDIYYIIREKWFNELLEKTKKVNQTIGFVPVSINAAMNYE